MENLHAICVYKQYYRGASNERRLSQKGIHGLSVVAHAWEAVSGRFMFKARLGYRVSVSKTKKDKKTKRKVFGYFG